MKNWYVYIITNHKHWTLYVGVTADIEKRISEHKLKLFEWFSSKYSLDKLVWFQECSSIQDAIQEEKRLKWWNRKQKIDLIECMNPDWEDLAS
jgi:putative endonuclease